MTAQALDFTWFVEDGFMVTGTQDPHVALAFATTTEDVDCRVDEIDMAQRNGFADPKPEDVRKLGDWCHEQLANARPGRWRWVGIPEDEQDVMDEATQYLVRTESGEGVFEGVTFQ
jgi:hypothetical protein